MLRASYWQWERHTAKQSYIQELDRRLALPITPLAELLKSNPTDWQSLIHRRVLVQGKYDFEHEMVLRNRRHDDKPGVFLLTPIKIKQPEVGLIVSRGYAPLRFSTKNARSMLHTESEVQFIGLVKETVTPKFFLAPQDPDPIEGWVDAWLRVDVQKIQKQIPYQLVPFFVEVMSTVDNAQVKELMIQSKSGRDELFLLPLRAPSEEAGEEVDSINDPNQWPVPVFDTVVPPGRHFGYIFEWAFMAFATFLICLVLQLRPGRNFHKPSTPTSVKLPE